MAKHDTTASASSQKPAHANRPGTHTLNPVVRDMLKGLLWAALIVLSLLFYTGAASHFIYVDF